jgi:hypothetical protein
MVKNKVVITAYVEPWVRDELMKLAAARKGTQGERRTVGAVVSDIITAHIEEQHGPLAQEG